jgi:hypothetical protein
VTDPGADRVECYSGHTYAQEPRAVVWQGRRFPVVRIERRWRTPEGPAFWVETETGIPFELHYGELEEIWTIRPHSDFNREIPGPEVQAEGGSEGENLNLHRDHHEDKEVRERT